MRGKHALHERLQTAGIAYAALGLGVSFYTISHFVQLHRNGPIIHQADVALAHSLVFTTVLLLGAAACAISGALLLKRFSP